MTKILIVDDEPLTRQLMARALGAKYECLTAPDADDALKRIAETSDLALVLTDYKMPGKNGIDLIRAAKSTRPDLGFILITAFGEIDMAVEAMKSGADDFLTKPISDLDMLELRVAKAIQKHAKAAPAAARPVSAARARDALGAFTGDSPAMTRVYDLIRRVAPTNASVLVEGPSGTGKELVARALHDLSPRAKGPFVAVECAALSKELLESELFGYEPHAFTGASDKGRIGRFEAARGGTLFLDEIGEIDGATQVKLLRALESRTIQRVGGNETIPVDFRLVTATNRHLIDLVAAGTFREDLFYRLDVIDIALPPLRERPGDIALLAQRFIKESAEANGRDIRGIDADALEALERYPWPGNVRQLKNVIERMTVLAAGGMLALTDVPAEIRQPGGADGVRALPSAPLSPSLADTEKAQIIAAVEAAGGNKSEAARRLGISRRTLHRKWNEWGLS